MLRIACIGKLHRERHFVLRTDPGLPNLHVTKVAITGQPTPNCTDWGALCTCTQPWSSGACACFAKRCGRIPPDGTCPIVRRSYSCTGWPGKWPETKTSASASRHKTGSWHAPLSVSDSVRMPIAAPLCDEPLVLGRTAVRTSEEPRPTRALQRCSDSTSVPNRLMNSVRCMRGTSPATLGYRQCLACRSNAGCHIPGGGGCEPAGRAMTLIAVPAPDCSSRGENSGPSSLCLSGQQHGERSACTLAAATHDSRTKPVQDIPDDTQPKPLVGSALTTVHRLE